MEVQTPLPVSAHRRSPRVTVSASVHYRSPITVVPNCNNSCFVDPMSNCSFLFHLNIAILDIIYGKL